MTRPVKPDTCAAGYPIGWEACEYCGATMDDCCKLLDEISPAQIRRNLAAVKRGEKPEAP